MVSANVCSEATQPFSYHTNNVGDDIILLTRSYAIDRKDYNTYTLSDCKEKILEANGVRFQDLHFIHLMETKYAGTGNNTKIDSNYGNDSFSRDEDYN